MTGLLTDMAPAETTPLPKTFKNFACPGCALDVKPKTDAYHCTQRRIWHQECFTRSQTTSASSQGCPGCKQPVDDSDADTRTSNSGIKWHRTCWEVQCQEKAIFKDRNKSMRDTCPGCMVEVKGEHGHLSASGRRWCNPPVSYIPRHLPAMRL